METSFCIDIVKNIKIILMIYYVLALILFIGLYLFFSASTNPVAEQFTLSTANEKRNLPLYTSVPNQKNIKFKRCTRLMMPKVEENVTNKFTRTEKEDWDVWFPCGYTNVEDELLSNNNFEKKEKGWVMGITGADNLAAKDRLWNIMNKRYGRLRAQIYVPESWVTYDAEQMKLFKSQAKSNPGTLYIMKKNIQRQEGLHLFTDVNEADNALANDYVVIQKVLGNPYLINGHKINIRVYVLISCKNGVKTLHAYNDGFVYYSKIPYTTGKSRDEVITSGYVDRKMYADNPLTVKDLYTYIAKHHGTAKTTEFVQMRNYILAGLMEAFSDLLCKVKNNVNFSQMYGVDMQPNSDLSDIKIIELNKGASLLIMDQRDGELKQKLTDDVYRTLGIIPDNTENGFSKVWTSST